MQFSTYQPVDLIFKLIVPENISIPRQAPKAFGAVKMKVGIIQKWQNSPHFTVDDFCKISFFFNLIELLKYLRQK